MGLGYQWWCTRTERRIVSAGSSDYVIGLLADSL